MHLYGKGLKADARIKPVFLSICSALAQSGGVHYLLVVTEAYVSYALALTGDICDKPCRNVHIVADVLALPDDGVARAQKVDSLVKAVDAGAYAPLFIHSLFLL